MIRSIAILLAFVAGTAFPATVSARSLPLIRDAEIERAIRAYSVPIFSAIGVAGGDVRVHIVNDRRLNAFVAGGRHIFINTGLLMKAEDAGMVIGVLAHEAGHIVGQHLTQLRGALREAQIQQILTFIIAAGAGVASGDGQTAGAVASLGNSIVSGTLYRYTRSMENEADAFALATLDRMGVSARGLAMMMERLMAQEALLGSLQDPYLRTHPLTRERLDRIRRHMRRSPHTAKPTPARFARYACPPAGEIAGIPFSARHRHCAVCGQGIGRRRRATRSRVAYHRAGPARQCPLDDRRPDPRGAARCAFFHELKGQILLERGLAARAARTYATAVRLAPKEALIRAAYAHALLQTGEQDRVPAALRHLVEATSGDRTYATAWRFRAVAHGRLKQFGESAAALAEYYLLLGDRAGVRRQVRRAERLLKRGSPSWRRIQDIKGSRLDNRSRPPLKPPESRRIGGSPNRERHTPWSTASFRWLLRSPCPSAAPPFRFRPIPASTTSRSGRFEKSSGTI